MKPNINNIEGKPDYESLRLDVLKGLLEERNIPVKNNKKDIIEDLILDDNGKYIRETIYEKNNNGFVIGIDLKNQSQLIQIGNFIHKNEARRLNMYSDNRIWFWSSQKLV